MSPNTLVNRKQVIEEAVVIFLHYFLSLFERILYVPGTFGRLDVWNRLRTAGQYFGVENIIASTLNSNWYPFADRMYFIVVVIMKFHRPTGIQIRSLR